ncbi:MAG: M14 family zinc carboxypeptidase [Kiritimatiellia bacterium]
MAIICGNGPLRLLIGHEGANPQDPSCVEQIGPRSFVVRPQSEDGDSNYKFAFDVIVENVTANIQQLDLTIDWAEPPQVGTTYMDCRRSVFLGTGENWQEICGSTRADKTIVSLTVGPGQQHVCLHPPYGSVELAVFLARAERQPQTRRIVFGRTAENRPLEGALLGSLCEERSALLVLARGHPYESAGSFCVEGVLDFLSGPEGARLRQHRSFLLVPIMNPDGVAHGLCKRTTLGADITHDGREGTDPTARAIVGLVCGMAAAPRPALWDVHGWMNPEDGLNFATGNIAAHIVEKADRNLFPRGWRNTCPSREAVQENTPNFRRYAASVLGMDGSSPVILFAVVLRRTCAR